MVSKAKTFRIAASLVWRPAGKAVGASAARHRGRLVKEI
jgi:hypothetical protein